jgi:hypothetical protein
VFFAKFMPISAAVSFDRFGMQYDPTAIVQDGKFNLELYKQYSPLFMPTTLAISYAVSFAAFAAVIVHTMREYNYAYPSASAL